MNLEELQSKINNIKVIENGEEELIGKVKDLRDYFIYNLAYNLLAEKEGNTENQTSNIILTSDILEQLEEYGENDILKIVYNPMGAYEISENLD